MMIELQLKNEKNDGKVWLEVWNVDRFFWEQHSKKIISFITNILKIYEGNGIVEFAKEELPENELAVFKVVGKPFVFYEVQENIDEYINALKSNRMLSF